MISLQRPDTEARIEIMPLIDVIFLLLTFFIYAMVLMVRAELLPMQLEAYAAGSPAKPAAAVTLSIKLDGSIHFNRTPVAVDEILGFVDVARKEDPKTVLYLALEDGEGTVDRGPMLTSMLDLLRDHDIDVSLVGRPTN